MEKMGVHKFVYPIYESDIDCCMLKMIRPETARVGQMSGDELLDAGRQIRDINVADI
jgi:hypothetical protein